ncbi:MAG: histidine phosphatase family protein [Anaerolineae bacterium]|nr:histidine phosphatase family protein [Anaerolineae bacterium]
MQFYFIRHAQSENNLLWQRTGSSKGRSDDPGLTAVGRQQAHLLTQHLRGPDPPMAAQGRNPQNVAGFGLTHLYSSLMVRAVATGTIIARVLGLPLVAWEEAHESGGIYRRGEQTDERIGQAGHNRAYFEAHYPDLVLPESLGESGWWNRPFEEPELRLPRAQRFLRDLIERHGHTDDRVAVVSHGGFYNYLLVTILNLPGREGYWFVMNNAAISRIDFNDEEIRLMYLNRVDFLPKELIT